MAKTWRNKAKITVLRKCYFQDLADRHLADPAYGPCALFQEGQEFIVDKQSYLTMLDGKFCSEAWAAISHYVYAALQGGSIMHGWTNDEKVMIACCSDGVRPVIFRIERLGEEAEEA